MSNPTERTAQKHRTREAILAGARELLAAGEAVTVAKAAQKQGISRATAYRYFKEPAALAAEAGLAVEVAGYEDVVQGAASVREKLLSINLYMIDLALENETAFRLFLSRSLEAYASGGAPSGGRRGARRIAMYDIALEPVRAKIGEDTARRLTSALAANTGAEAMIALVDVAGIDIASVRSMVAEMTEALLDAYLGAEVD